MPDFCTYFDSNYLPRGLALYRSLRRHCVDARLSVLALDDDCADVLRRLAPPGLTIVPLSALEAEDPHLAQAKDTRLRIEYYFTCTPAFALNLLAKQSPNGVLTYLDADLFFFSDPAPLFAELGEAAVGITAHRFPLSARHLETYGLYNVGWLSFRRIEPGLACLAEWRQQCLEWCHDRLEGDRFADQKYLDAWPERHDGVVVLSHPGANVAPWNVTGLNLGTDGAGGVTVDGAPLIFYHFHGLRRAWPGVYDPRITEFRGALPRVLRGRVYSPYIKAVRHAALDCGWPPARDPFAASARPTALRQIPGVFSEARQLLRRRYVIPVLDRS